MRSRTDAGGSGPPGSSAVGGDGPPPDPTISLVGITASSTAFGLMLGAVTVHLIPGTSTVGVVALSAVGLLFGAFAREAWLRRRRR